MKALFLKGRSAYEATRLFIEEVAQAFRRRGLEAVVVDLADAGQAMDHLKTQIAGQRFDLAYSIGLFGELRDGEGLSLAEVLQAPHVVQYVDYPLSHYFRLSETPAATALLVVDPSHVEALRAVYGPDRFKHVAFSPHGAVGEPKAIEAEPDAFLAARDIPMLFPGSFYKPGPAMWEKLDQPTRRVFDAAVERALGEEFLPAVEAFDWALQTYGGNIDAQAMRVNAFAVHERVRSHRRFEMLKAAAKAGLSLQVFGSGYERDLYRFKNVTYGGERTLAEITDLMRRSRVVLNVNANFGRGSHERPLSAMMAGAAAASDRSDFFDESFGPEAMVQLRWRHLAEDLVKLGKLLDEPDRLHAIARNGQARALTGHRWDNRVDAILAAADAVRV